MAGWRRESGPAIAPASALRRLADEPALVMLHGCGLGGSCLAWGMDEIDIADFSALDAFAGTAPAGPPAAPANGPIGAGWNLIAGGAMVQLDYEFPAVPGRAWWPDAIVAWDRRGRCSLHARTRAGLARLRGGLARREAHLAAPRLAGGLSAAWNAAAHAARVERIRAWIAAGDIYQANLTLPFRGRMVPGVHRDLALFLALTAASPAPLSAFFRYRDGRTVISHSPERFLTVAGRAVASEPIKGTRRREPGRDTAMRRELLGAAKDRAELAMIVDLVRNDLGRTAVPGSVRVVEPAAVMDLPYVHHLVARVAARLRPDARLCDVVAAAFPAGSITGAPKLRAMQIIRELEDGPRGAYCGAFGWIGGDRRRPAAELAVAIRTLVVAGDEVRLHSGGGIVADSDPAAEWDEVRAKAAAMAAALGAEL